MGKGTVKPLTHAFFLFLFCAWQLLIKFLQMSPPASLLLLPLLLPAPGLELTAKGSIALLLLPAPALA
jgi:hypothetical protein